MGWRAKEEGLDEWESAFRIEAATLEIVRDGRHWHSVEELERLLSAGKTLDSLRAAADGILIAALAELGDFERAQMHLNSIGSASRPDDQVETDSGRIRLLWCRGDEEGVVAVADRAATKTPGSVVIRVYGDWGRMALGRRVPDPPPDDVPEYLKPGIIECRALPRSVTR